MVSAAPSTRASEIGERVERFMRDVIVPYERDPRYGTHGPPNDLVDELRSKARSHSS